jgi:hypothetical protein
MTAEQYNARRAGSLWLVDDLPLALQASGEPDSAAFAAWVRGWQRNHGLEADGKLGPRTWGAMRAELFEPDQPEPVPAPVDSRVDTRAEARAVLSAGMRYSPHLRGELEAALDILQGSWSMAAALRVLRAARHDGRIMVADILRKGGKDAEELYQHKARTAADMRRAYSSRWHEWINPDHRHGIGVHWSAGTGDVEKLADYLIRRRPGRVSTNAIIGYDGSTVFPFAAFPDVANGDPECIFTAHGAHNPGCIGLDFTSPGFLERRGGRWYAKGGGPVPDRVIDTCGVVTLEDLELRSWPGKPTAECPWIYRDSKPGKVYSVRHFLAPSWAQLAAFLVVGRALTLVFEWTDRDLVLLGHHQRSASRADVFHYPLRWLRADMLSGVDVLTPDHWLARVNAEKVNGLLNEYRREVRGLGW